jgi:hypothetical protein
MGFCYSNSPVTYHFNRFSLFMQAAYLVSQGFRRRDKRSGFCYSNSPVTYHFNRFSLFMQAAYLVSQGFRRRDKRSNMLLVYSYLLRLSTYIHSNISPLFYLLSWI